MSTDNPSAFPTGHIVDFGFTDYDSGMSLRDWQWTQFAKNPPKPDSDWLFASGEITRGDMSRALAKWACDYADDMMAEVAKRAERAKPKGEDNV